MTPNNEKQADLPEGAELVSNPMGTAGVGQNLVQTRPDGSRSTVVKSGTCVIVSQIEGLGSTCPYLHADRGRGPEFVADILAVQGSI